MAKIIIDGNPVAKGRPRFTKRGIAYTPAKTKTAEEMIAWEWKNQSKQYFDDIPIKVNIDFYKSPPKSTSKKKLELMENKAIRPTTRPDIDNYIKLVLDSLNGVAFKDDNQICELVSRKFYSTNPRIEIEMSELVESLENYNDL